MEDHEIPFPVLHVHLGPARPDRRTGLVELVRAVELDGRVRQLAVLGAGGGEPGLPIPADRVRHVDRGGPGPAPPGTRPSTLLAVARALRELVEDPSGGRRAVQWPVPERWAVVHAHGAAALRAVWLAAALRGRNPRVLATPLPGDASAPAGLWRKAELVAPPAPEIRESLARRGVERRRLRTLSPDDPDDDGGHLGLYRKLASGERRRVQPVDWSLSQTGRGR